MDEACAGQEDAPAEREDEVPQHGGPALEAGEYLVEEPRAERAAVGHGRETGPVRFHQLYELVGGGAGEVVRLEIVGEPPGGGQVRLEEAEQGALVLLVADDHGDGRILSRQDQGVWRLGDGLAVRTGQVGQRERVVGQDAGHRGDGIQEVGRAQGPEACQLVCGVCAAARLGDLVEHGLRLGRVERVRGNDAARVHDGPAEQGLPLVRVVALVQNHLAEHRDGARRLAPDGHLVRVASKGGDVVGNPLQAHALVEQAGVSRALGHDFLAWHEAVARHAILDRDKDEWLVDGLGMVDETCAVVHRCPPKLEPK